MVDFELKEALGIQRVVVVKSVFQSISRLCNVYLCPSYFSTRIFTEALLPVLKRTDSLLGSDVRIVTVSSVIYSSPEDLIESPSFSSCLRMLTDSLQMGCISGKLTTST